MTITTFSLNPTIDVSSETDLVRPTHKIRTSDEHYEPGGGGVNVARVITELGGRAQVICPAGGFPGRMLDSLLGAIPLPRTIVPIEGNTRISFTVFERKTGHEFRFTPNGPTLSTAEFRACLDAVKEADYEYFVASGSLALGAPRDAFARVARIVKQKGAKFILDSSGAGLGVTLSKGGIYLVKPSIGELEAFVGRRLDHASAEDAAKDLVRRGCAEIVAVTMGAAGAMVVSKGKTLKIRSPHVEARSAVGAGDAFVGAMTLALSKGEPLHAAAMFAIAAGAATTLTPLAKVCARRDVHRLHRQVKQEHPNLLKKARRR